MASDQGFSSTEKTSLLFKKLMGAPATLMTRQFFEEPSRPARPAILASKQIWAEDLPSSAPSDLHSVSVDDNGNSIIGSHVGKTSSQYPQIRKYVKIPLTMIAGSNHMSYESFDVTQSHPKGYDDGDYSQSQGTASNFGTLGSYGRVLQDTIPFNYASDGSYLITLYRFDGQTEINMGHAGGDWMLDNESGVITFYGWRSELNVKDITPPCITFYRYVGSKGVGSGGGGNNTVFASGDDDNGIHQDSLKSIQIDDANIASINVNNLSHCLQFGSTADGAWRLAAIGGGGDATKTRFVIQVRQNGVWGSKIYLTAN